MPHPHGQHFGGVSSGPTNATPAEAPTTMVEAPQRTGVA